MTSGRPRIAIYFASHDGQTRKIVDCLAGHLGGRDVGVSLIDLMAGTPPTIDPEADLILVAAAIRYGYHLSAARHFLRRLQVEVPAERIAVLSVNLTARKPGRQNAEGNIYLRKWLMRARLRPALAAAVAGKLDYPAYRWFDRMMIQAIMHISGGPTDASTIIEYTDWAQVEALAGRIAALAMTSP
jgi:menaquinone-dependent protoporphyrinogen oxidase